MAKEYIEAVNDAKESNDRAWGMARAYGSIARGQQLKGVTFGVERYQGRWWVVKVTKET